MHSLETKQIPTVLCLNRKEVPKDLQKKKPEGRDGNLLARKGVCVILCEDRNDVSLLSTVHRSENVEV
jgi:hypothetical protein